MIGGDCPLPHRQHYGRCNDYTGYSGAGVYTDEPDWFLPAICSFQNCDKKNETDYWYKNRFHSLLENHPGIKPAPFFISFSLPLDPCVPF
jgi:hypothetical protein